MDQFTFLGRYYERRGFPRIIDLRENQEIYYNYLSINEPLPLTWVSKMLYWSGLNGFPSMLPFFYFLLTDIQKPTIRVNTHSIPRIEMYRLYGFLQGLITRNGGWILHLVVNMIILEPARHVLPDRVLSSTPNGIRFDMTEMAATGVPGEPFVVKYPVNGQTIVEFDFPHSLFILKETSHTIDIRGIYAALAYIIMQVKRFPWMYIEWTIDQTTENERYHAYLIVWSKMFLLGYSTPYTSDTMDIQTHGIWDDTQWGGILRGPQC
jgi:hypothetical protein